MCCFALFLYIRKLQEKLHSSLKASLKYILLIFVYFKMYLFFILQLTKSRLMPGLPALNLPEKCIIPSSRYLLFYPIYFEVHVGYESLNSGSFSSHFDCSAIAKPKPSAENIGIEISVLPPT